MRGQVEWGLKVSYVHKSGASPVRRHRFIVGLLSSLASVTLTPAVVQGTEGTSDEDEAALDEVLVTARRREENLMAVPIAVTALTEAALAQRNITNLMEVSDFTPGLHHTDETVSSNSGRADRTGYDLIFRGNSLHSGTVFIDGTPVVGNRIPPFADVARIEVLKGPQAVYFGRSTYTGAINFITRDPGNTFAGRITGEYGSYGSNKASVSVEGPVVNGLLAARISASHDFKGGHYRNQTTGGRIGDRQTDSVSLSLSYTPTDKLRIKNWMSFAEDEDGVTPNISLRGPSGDFLPSQLNCNLGGTRGAYYCGTLPDWDELPPGAISANDEYSLYMREVFVGNAMGAFEATDSDFLDHVGFRRHHFSDQLRADYTTDSGYVVSFLGGYHWAKQQLLTDMTMVDGRYYPNPNYGTIPGVLPYQTWFFNQQGRRWDFSLEARVTSPNEGRLRWTVGTSFLRSDSTSSTYAVKPTGPGGSQAPSREHPSTLGIFGGLYYDITPNLTATVEARWQEDRIRTDQIGGSDGIAFPGGPIKFAADFTHIAPRISLDYRFSENSMVYVLFSQGYRPGGFNAQLNTASQFVLDQLAEHGGAGKTFDEERLDNYEIGLKSTFLGGRARTTIAAYYNKVRDGQTGDQINIISDTGDPTIMFLTTNIGAIDFRGLEFEGQLQATRQLRIGLNANFVDSEVKNFFCADCRSIYGNPDATGNEFQQTVKSKYSIYADYTGQLNDNYGWYVRGDYNYRSSYYIETANVAKVPAQHLAGLRVGLETDTFTLEAYATNLLYDKGLRGSPGLDTVHPSGSFPNEIRATLPDKRTVGLKVAYDF